jgi:hypothetical protein
MEDRKDIKLIYEAWKASGKTQRAFCEENGVKMGWFKYHVLEGRKSGVLSGSKRDGRVGAFAAVRVTGAASEEPAAYCEILFGGKLGIRIENRESLGQLRQLLGILL